MNLLIGITQTKYYDYYLIYILPFILMILVCIFIKTFKLDYYLFLSISILSVIFGTWNNLSGATFLTYAIYSNRNKIIIATIVLFIIALAIKFTFFIESVPRTLNFLIGNSYIIAIYYIYFHPKIIIIENDPINKKIIEYLTRGLTSIEISNKLNITQDAIRKRLKNMRNKYNCGNNIQLAIAILEKRNYTIEKGLY